MMFSRRDFSVLALASGAGLAALPARAQTAVDMAKVLAASSLPTHQLGKDDAKITVVEYASLTCGHCAAFHNDTVPKLKDKYIESGKVRLIFRHFVLNPLDMAASMLVNALPADKYFAGLETFYKAQESWAFGKDPLAALTAMAKQIGFTQESFEAALKDQALMDKLVADRERASSDFKIDSTPTLIINGMLSAGAKSIDELDKIFEPILKM